jgi:membrane peptidoglycan carboxypeptidase
MVEMADAGRQPTPPSAHGTLLVQEIRDRDGNVLWKAVPKPRLVGDPVVGRMTGEVLRNVVRWGTGRRALSVAQVEGGTVPLTGKTGTTNSFRNAAFCGFVPRSGSDGWSWADGYTLAAYVGFDDNTPMSRGGVRIAGSSGALPGWMHTAAGLGEAGLLGTAKPSESAELRVAGGFSRVALRADGAGIWEPIESISVTDEDRYTVVWGAGVLADGSLDVSRRLTLVPEGDAEASSRPLPMRADGDAVEAPEPIDDLGDDIDPFIAPEASP